MSKTIFLNNTSEFSGYGKTAEDVTRHCQTKIVPANDHKKLEKLERSPLCQVVTQILTEESDVAALEVKMKKRKIVDDKPIHYGLAILQWSKLLFCNFMFF